MSDFEQYLIEQFGETWERSGIMEAALAAEQELRQAAIEQAVAELKRQYREQLAAEREEWQLATEECHRIISRKNEELAAEREKVKEAYEKGRKHNDVAIAQPLRKQLAAEREKREPLLQQLDDADLECSQLRQQLAAEKP